jgi:tetratricopeptide (TPR) repeat protein
MAETISEATNAADALGLHATAATGHYLLSVLHQEAGDTRRAERSTLRAAEAGRAADEKTRAHQLANTARCLLELEAEIGRSRDLLAEAGTIADDLGLDLCELHWARGLLARWDGQEDFAHSSISRALVLARQNEDRWREYKCLTWLAMLAHESGRYADMDADCAELRAVALRVGEDETPFVETLQALVRLAAQDRRAKDALESALVRLRTVDDKTYLAYVLNGAARIHHKAGRIEAARQCATEALTAASVMQRPSEVVIARAVLAAVGDKSAECNVGDSGADCSTPLDLSARARAAWTRLDEPAIPTTASTDASQVKGRNRS